MGQELTGYGRGFTTGVEDLVHGVTGPLAKSGILGEHVKRGFEPYAKGRKEDYERSLEEAPAATKFGKMTGDIGIRAPGSLLAIILANPGFLSQVGGQAAAGFGHGFAKEGREGESRTLSGLVEGAEGAALPLALRGIFKAPGAAQSLYKGAKGLPEKIRNLNPERHQNVLKGKEKELAPALAEYRGIEEVLEKGGKTQNIKPANIDWKRLEDVPHEEFKDLMPLNKIKELAESATIKVLRKPKVNYLHGKSS